MRDRFFQLMPLFVCITNKIGGFMKPDFKLYPQWGVPEDDISYLQYKELFIKDPNGGTAIEFHAGKSYVDMDPIHEAYHYDWRGECPRTKITVYQGDSWGTEGVDYVEFGEITLPYDFRLLKSNDSKSSQSHSKSQQIWNKVVVKRFKTKRLPDGYEISYIQ